MCVGGRGGSRAGEPGVRDRPESDWGVRIRGSDPEVLAIWPEGWGAAVADDFEVGARP